MLEGQFSCKVRFGVKLGRTQPEHISSALPPTATVERTFQIGSFVPTGDIEMRGFDVILMASSTIADAGYR
jgi:hypothetical protein